MANISFSQNGFDISGLNAAEFKVLWTALQQFSDNRETIEDDETEPEEVQIAERLLPEFEAAFVTAVEGR